MFNNYPPLLLTLKIRPMLNILISKLDPPYERNGKVTPVTGIKPTTTQRFNIAWNIIWKVRPNIKYFLNKLSSFNANFIPQYAIIKNINTTNKAPMTPNSSQIIENIKSVCGSGR